MRLWFVDKSLTIVIPVYGSGVGWQDDSNVSVSSINRRYRRAGRLIVTIPFDKWYRRTSRWRWVAGTKAVLKRVLLVIQEVYRPMGLLTLYAKFQNMALNRGAESATHREPAWLLTYEQEYASHSHAHQRNICHKSTSAEQDKKLFQRVSFLWYYSKYGNQGRTQCDEKCASESRGRKVFTQENSRQHGVPKKGYRT